MSSDKALEALKSREYRHALSLLKRELATRSDGELHALAGLASFQLEDYAAAVEHYTAALQSDGQRSVWREMLAVAQANADRRCGRACARTALLRPRRAARASLSAAKTRCPRRCRLGLGTATSRDCASSLGDLLGVGSDGVLWIASPS